MGWDPEGRSRLESIKQTLAYYLTEKTRFVAFINQRSEQLKAMELDTLADYDRKSETLSRQAVDAGQALAASRLDAAIQRVMKLWPDFITQPNDARKAAIAAALSAVAEQGELLKNSVPGLETGWVAGVSLEAGRLNATLDNYHTLFTHHESQSGVLTSAAEKLNAAVNALYQFQTEQATLTITKASFVMYIAVALGVLVGLLIAWRITRNITQPLRETLLVADKIASGDLTARIDTQRGDEPGLLMQAVGRMNQNLQEIILQVRQGVDNVARASAEIAAGNIDLSSRTEQQSAAVVETAASMEQLTSTVKQNADNAHQASRLAQEASHNAGRGGEIVQDVVVTMEDISASSRKIADIINVINGIAFQTNILALNAAVEAARAGEQGRGFAVVAGEVRSLAQRSAQAAKEIKALIEDSVARVDTGSVLVESAGETMHDIVSAVTRVTDIMGEIASASDEQSRGIDQVGLAVTEMDRVTQQNAALVEESASAAASLEDQASRLKQAVSVFNIGKEFVAQAVNRTTASKSLRLDAPAAASRAPAVRSDDNWETF
ncbi:MAG TPA: methyl-accepting chemotaxis protein [Pantoea septica]|nr:methyl-accepting chemotaxis protein [Pantoea septica]